MKQKGLQTVYKIIGEIIYHPIHKDNFIDPKTGEKYIPLVSVLPIPNVINAWAGRTESAIEIAVFQGALDNCDEGMLKALLAHEISHIANKDFEIRRRIYVFTTTILLTMALASFALGVWAGVVGIILAFWIGTLAHAKLIQTREELADLHGAIIAGRSNMIRLLESISNGREYNLYERLRALTQEHPHWRDRIDFIKYKLPTKPEQELALQKKMETPVLKALALKLLRVLFPPLFKHQYSYFQDRKEK